LRASVGSTSAAGKSLRGSMSSVRSSPSTHERLRTARVRTVKLNGQADRCEFKRRGRAAWAQTAGRTAVSSNGDRVERWVQTGGSAPATPAVVKDPTEFPRPSGTSIGTPGGRTVQGPCPSLMPPRAAALGLGFSPRLSSCRITPFIPHDRPGRTCVHGTTT
jgi:hypothetical protein